MGHDGFQTVASAMSQGNGPQVSECSAMSLGQPKSKRRGHKRATPTSAKARRGKKALKVKVSLAGPAKNVKKPRKKKGTKKKGTSDGRRWRFKRTVSSKREQRRKY